MIPATPVGQIVAKSEAELGFQQISELKPVAARPSAPKASAEIVKSGMEPIATATH